ncbi:MAG: hypothetical protein ABSG03_33060 [Bryobacteraceae bacterium]
MIALALNAAPAASPLDLLAAAEIPAAGPKTAGGSRFHSMFKAATDADDHPKAKPAKKDSAPDNATSTAVPVPAQRAAAPPLTLNLFPGSDPAHKNDGDDSEAPSTADEKPAARRIAEASAQPRIPPEEASAANRAAQRSATESQPDPDQPLAVAASAADGSLSKIDPAFEMRLQPTEPQESSAPSQAPSATADSKSGDPRSTKDDPAEPAAAAAPDAAPGVSQSAASSSKHGDGSHHPGQEKPQDPASAAPQPGASADLAQARFDVNAPVPPAGSMTSPANAASRSETPAPAEATPEPSTPPAAAAAPVAHDIKLELNVGGGQRVEVRLTDRAGDIHVAVRTPDARLSDAMRADLPALAAKLEQSGFRTDAWQPGSAAGGERRTAETGAGNGSQDSQEHAGQNQQQKQDNPQQQQQQKSLINAPNRKSDRKDFAWLLQTYR